MKMKSAFIAIGFFAASSICVMFACKEQKLPLIYANAVVFFGLGILFAVKSGSWPEN